MIKQPIRYAKRKVRTPLTTVCLIRGAQAPSFLPLFITLSVAFILILLCFLQTGSLEVSPNSQGLVGAPSIFTAARSDEVTGTEAVA